MIQNYFDNVKKNRGVKIPNVRVREGGASAFTTFTSGGSPAKWARRAGKKEEGLGEGIFARLPHWGEKRLVLAQARKQSPQKLFP
jgi:hypothetical protein